VCVAVVNNNKSWTCFSLQKKSWICFSLYDQIAFFSTFKILIPIDIVIVWMKYDGLSLKFDFI